MLRDALVLSFISRCAYSPGGCWRSRVSRGEREHPEQDADLKADCRMTKLRSALSREFEQRESSTDAYRVAWDRLTHSARPIARARLRGPARGWGWDGHEEGRAHAWNDLVRLLLILLLKSPV